MRKRIGGILAALVLGAAVGVALEGTASASDPTCSSGDFCAYSNNNLTGAVWTWFNNDANWSNDTNAGIVASNHSKSWRNRGLPCFNCDHVWLFDTCAADGTTDSLLHVLSPGVTVSGTGATDTNRRASCHSWGGPLD